MKIVFYSSFALGLLISVEAMYLAHGASPCEYGCDGEIIWSKLAPVGFFWFFFSWLVIYCFIGAIFGMVRKSCEFIKNNKL